MFFCVFCYFYTTDFQCFFLTKNNITYWRVVTEQSFTHTVHKTVKVKIRWIPLYYLHVLKSMNKPVANIFPCKILWWYFEVKYIYLSSLACPSWFQHKLSVLWKELCILSDWARYIPQGKLQFNISNMILIIAPGKKTYTYIATKQWKIHMPWNPNSLQLLLMSCFRILVPNPAK